MATKPKVTVEEAVKRWLDHCGTAGFAVNTLRARRTYANAYITPRLGHLLTTSVTPESVRPLHSKPAKAKVGRTAPLSGQVQRQYRSILRDFLVFCEVGGLLKHGVDSLMQQLPKPRVARRRVRLQLTATEMLAALEACEHPRDRMLIAMAIFTGFRISEIESLRVRDVDLDRGEIFVTIHKTFEEDEFPIATELATELRRYLTWYAEYAAAEGMGVLCDDWYLVPAKWSPQCAPTPGGFVVLHPGHLRPKEPMTNDVAVRAAHRALRAIGRDGPGEGMHTFRRSAARAFFELHRHQGTDHALLVTQTFLHHSVAATTQRYLGIQHEREIRDRQLKGKPFLTALLPDSENVIPLDSVRGSGA